MKTISTLIFSATILSACSESSSEPRRFFQLGEGAAPCKAAIESVADVKLRQDIINYTSSSTTYIVDFTDVANSQNKFSCEVRKYKIHEILHNGKSIIDDVPAEMREF